MILRMWGARANAHGSAGYPDHFRHIVLPTLQKIAGFRGATLMQQNQGNEVAFVVLTRWESLAAIRAFAGEDIAQAIVEPEAADVLKTFDRTVQHYDVVAELHAD